MDCGISLFVQLNTARLIPNFVDLLLVVYLSSLCDCNAADSLLAALFVNQKRNALTVSSTEATRVCVVLGHVATSGAYIIACIKVKQLRT